MFSKVESSNLVTSQNPTEFDAKIDRLCLMLNVAHITSMFRATFLSILPNKLIFDFPKRLLSYIYGMLCFSWQLLFVIQAHNRTAEKCNGSTLKHVSLLMCKLYNLQSKALSTIFACVELNSTGVWGSARVVSLALLSWFSSQCNVIDDGNEIRVSLAAEYKLKQKRV